MIYDEKGNERNLSDQKIINNIENNTILKESKNKKEQDLYKTYFDFYDTLYTIHERLYYVYCFNFGFKQNASQFIVFAKLSNMSEKDKNSFLWLAEKYRFDILCTPYVLFDVFKNELMSTFGELFKNVVYANSMYPTNEFELNKKRQYINDAMNGCYWLIQILEMGDQVFKFDHEKLLLITKPIFDQISILKQWKKSTANKYDLIMNEERKRKVKENSLCPIYVVNKDGSYSFCSNYHKDPLTYNELLDMKSKVIIDINNRKQQEKLISEANKY